MALKLPKTPFLEGVKTNQSYFLSFLKLCNYFVFTIFAFIVRILADFLTKKAEIINFLLQIQILFSTSIVYLLLLQS